MAADTKTGNVPYILVDKVLQAHEKILIMIELSGLSDRGLKTLLNLERSELEEAKTNLTYLKRIIADASSR